MFRLQTSFQIYAQLAGGVGLHLGFESVLLLDEACLFLVGQMLF